MPLEQPLAPVLLERDAKSSRAPAPDKASTASWAACVDAFRHPSDLLLPPWRDVFAPLRSGTVDDLVVVGQIGQSLDGRIATTSGQSKYINGSAGLDHLHRLRALVDAVVIGVGTAQADDPQLTVRRVAGPHPARVVLDPRGRLSPHSKLLLNDGVRRIVITQNDADLDLPSDVEIVALRAHDGHIAPSSVLGCLAERGFRRVLVEGGANTLSRFVAARCLDRLHIVVAPIILGTGPTSFALPAIDRVDQALSAPMRMWPLREDVLFDCDLSAQRVCLGRAKKST